MTKVINTTDPRVRAQLEAIPGWIKIRTTDDQESPAAAYRTKTEFRRVLRLIAARFFADNGQPTALPVLHASGTGTTWSPVTDMERRSPMIVSREDLDDEDRLDDFFGAAARIRGRDLNALPSAEVARMAGL